MITTKNRVRGWGYKGRGRGVDYDTAPISSMDLDGNHISRMIVQKYDTVALKWKNSQIAANVLSDAIYIPYVEGTGINTPFALDTTRSLVNPDFGS